jgi:hypothetical protein
VEIVEQVRIDARPIVNRHGRPSTTDYISSPFAS